MTLSRALALVLVLQIASLISARAEGAKEALDRRIGTWTTETTFRKAAWTPEQITTKGEETIKWTLDKSVQVSEGWAQPGDQKSTGLMLFDEETQQIRGWWFNNKGVFPRSETIGRWDPKAETLHLRSEFDGNNQIVKIVFTNKDRIDWTMVIVNNDGDLMMDAVGHTARKKIKAAAAKRSPEHQVLDRFVGTWDVDLSIKFPGQEVAKEEAVETRRWSQGGKVVHFENAEGTEFHMLLGYDPETRTYPGVILAGTFRTLMTGTWDAKTTTMSFTGIFPDGTRFKGAHRFVDENHAEALSSTTNPAGNVIMSRIWKQTKRQK